jgi:hypothetical protein
MQDIEGSAAKLHGRRIGVAFRPITDIDVSPDGGDGRNPAKSVQHFRPSDITAMDDVRYASEAPHCLRPQQAVSVRDDSDPRMHRLQTFLSAKALAK